jgi:nitrile hydratase accessory protein
VSVDPPPFVGQPRDGDEPAFSEPWEAQAFAITLALQKDGVFSWSEWGRVFGARIASAQVEGDAEMTDTYYHKWFDALETMILTKRLTTGAELDRYRHAWEHAADRTPHGQSIDLRPSDFQSADGN